MVPTLTSFFHPCQDAIHLVYDPRRVTGWRYTPFITTGMEKGWADAWAWQTPSRTFYDHDEGPADLQDGGMEIMMVHNATEDECIDYSLKENQKYIKDPWQNRVGRMPFYVGPYLWDLVGQIPWLHLPRHRQQGNAPRMWGGPNHPRVCHEVVDKDAVDSSEVMRYLISKPLPESTESK